MKKYYEQEGEGSGTPNESAADKAAEAIKAAGDELSGCTDPYDDFL